MKHRYCKQQSHHGSGRWKHKKKLQRRIFLWSGSSIVFTAIIVLLAFRAMSPTERIQQDVDGMHRFVSARFEVVWDDPPAREELVRDLHDDLRLDVTVVDASGQVVAQRGRQCEEVWATVPLTRRDGAQLGEVTVCGERYRWGGWRFFVVLFVVIGILWASAGMLARRMLRPLRRLEHMARSIADGDLAARSELTPERDGELGMLGRIMDDMAGRIDRQLTDQRELLAAVSHELRTPLGHLRLLLEMARENPSEKLMNEIEEEVLEIDALVGQLLASSRVDFGTLHTKAVDAEELARRTLGRLDLPEDLLVVEGEIAMIEADPTLLGRAIANLLTNAKQHGHGVRRLIVRYLRDEVVFAVEDRGPGFPQAERDKVFEPFFRGEHRAGGSLGLGLSLVQRIAAAHGGRAWVEDVEEGGARVLFSLSAIELEAAAES